ncbi:MAG: transglutaminase domain-containing protein [Anaerolineales bacterium]|nr:transglutaminase domain-containing protein [Anaerolineales bacterium]
MPLVIFVLETSMAGTFLFGLGKTVVGFDVRAFIVAAFLAILLPRFSAFHTRGRLRGAVLLLAGGIGVVLISTLRVWTLLLRLGLVSVSNAYYLATGDPLAQYLDLTYLYSRFGERVDILGNSLKVWLQYLLAGESIQVSQVTQLIWGLAAFVTLLWVGLFLHVKKRPFVAVLPPILLLGINSELTNYPLHFFGMLFALALLIVVVSTHQAREQSWTELGIGYSLDIRMDLWGAAALFCIAAFLISVFPPELSIRTILDKIDLITNKAETSIDLTSGLGLSELYPDEEPSESNGRMPSSHLITTPPEQLETHLFDVWVGDQFPEFSANWRTHNYQTYTGHGWLAGETSPRRYQAEEMVLSGFPSRQVSRRITVWARTETVEGELIHAHQVVRVDQPVEILWRDGPASLQDYAMGLVSEPLYTVQISRPVIEINQLKTSGFTYPDWVESRYLQLPDDLPDEVVRLSTEFSSRYTDPFSRAKAIESYLRQFPYTLDVPAPPVDQDVVAYFLFDLKKGYCDYFATAMAVLARGAGMPSRVVGGYSSGEFQAEEKLFRVTAADAHTWVEIYFAGTGWVEFEPTPARPLFTYESHETEDLLDEPIEEGNATYSAISNYHFFPLWVGGLVLILVLGIMGWQRIRYLLLPRSHLLLRAREGLYQTAALLEVSAPQCLTPREIMIWICTGISAGFTGRITRYLTRHAHETVQRVAEKLELAAYRGISPVQMKKTGLVTDLVQINRVIRQIRLAKILQKPTFE